MSSYSFRLTSFTGPAEMFRLIFSESERIGAKFKEEISYEKMIEIALCVSNFVFDTRYALLSTDVIFKEIKIGPERIMLQRQDRCYLISLLFQDKTHEIELALRNMDQCELEPGDSPNSYKISLRTYEIYHWEIVEKNKGTLKSKL